MSVKTKSSIRSFNPHLICGSQSMRTLLAEILAQLEGYEAFHKLRTRRRSKQDQHTFERIVEAVVCDLTLRELEHAGGGIHLPFSNQILRRKSRYKGSALSKTLPDILKIMSSEGMDFVELKKGSRKLRILDDDLNLGVAGGEQTILHAGPKLHSRIKRLAITIGDIAEDPEEEVVILRGKKPRDDKRAPTLEYDDTPQTLRMRHDLQSINAFLRQAKIECGLKGTNTNARRVRRIFHDGSFALGGRLYGGFWQALRSDDRLEHIRIGDDAVDEIDIGQASILILYGIAKAIPPSGDLYDLSAQGLPVTARDGIKKVMNALIASSKPLSRMPKGARPAIPRRFTLKEVIVAIDKRHPSLASHWSKVSYGEIWRIESDILVETLLTLNAQGIPALPIHDAIVVADEHLQEASRILQETFKTHLNITPTITLNK